MARLIAGRPLEDLEQRIGIAIRDRSRFERALTHSSLRPKGGSEPSYERLEFLGDRVLGLIVADRLFEKFPRADEGELSLRLNALVSADACAQIADEIGLYDFVRHGGDLKALKSERTKNIRADLVESLIAAIYLDGGLEAARSFVLRQWGDRFDTAAEARRDAKTMLQEWAHTFASKPPLYEVVERSGPDHEPMFTVRVSVEGHQAVEGRGRSKRIAEREAASELLRRAKVWKDQPA